MNFPRSFYRSFRIFFEKPALTRKIFFLHIPKCGGTSLDSAIRTSYNSYSRPIQSHSFRLNSRASLRASQLCGMNLGNYCKQILYYLMALQGMTYISGHFSFCEKAYEQFGSEWDFITVLRHPVSRWFSQYFFNKYKEDGHLKISDDLETYLLSDEGQSWGHFYVYILTGHGAGSKSIPTQAINKAITNLDKFPLVGCLEHLDDFINDFETLYHTKLEVGEKNKSPVSNSFKTQHITEEIQRKVEEICQPDLEVYNYALSRIGHLG